MESKIEIVWNAESDSYHVLQSGAPQSVFFIGELEKLKAEIDRILKEVSA